MDKIDELLFNYKIEYKMNNETKKRYRIIMVPEWIMLVIGVVLEVGFLLTRKSILCLLVVLTGIIVIMSLWLYFWNGTIGTKKWKKRVMCYYRERFVEEQQRLVNLINREGMSCQQVYNLLHKKNNRMPKKEDKPVYIISICSVIVALTNVLVGPLQKASEINYFEYILIALLFIVVQIYIWGPLYKIGIILTESSDISFLKRNKYQKIMKLLEDYLY